MAAFVGATFRSSIHRRVIRFHERATRHAKFSAMPRAAKDTSADASAARLRLASAMQREGNALMRENLRRRHPDASEAELDALFERWLLDRPPDAPGRRVSWPRKRRPRAV
jgi:hypothetical protein